MLPKYRQETANGAASYARYSQSVPIAGVPPAVEGAAPTPSNAAECIVVTAVRSQRSLLRDCGWVDERGCVE